MEAKEAIKITKPKLKIFNKEESSKRELEKKKYYENLIKQIKEKYKVSEKSLHKHNKASNYNYNNKYLM